MKQLEINRLLGFVGLLSMLLMAPGRSYGEGLTIDGDLTVASNLTVQGGIDWTAGKVHYVPAGADIQAAVDAASSGDTLVLASGTYATDDDIDVTKSLHVRGQGRGVTTIATTNSIIYRLLRIAADNVQLSDFTVDVAASCTVGVEIDGTGGAVLSGVRIDAMDVVLNEHAGEQRAIWIRDANVEVCDCMVSAHSVDDVAMGIYAESQSSAESAMVVRCRNVVALSAGHANAAFGVGDYPGGAGATMLVESCRGVSSGDPADHEVGAVALVINGAVAVADNSVLSGLTLDVANNGGSITLRNCQLSNGTTLGTITREGWLYTEGLQLNTGAAVTNILTAAGSNDTSLVTSGEIDRRIAAGGGAGGGVADHGALTGLADDDHPQYVLADGSRAFTGDVGIGTAAAPQAKLDVNGTGRFQEGITYVKPLGDVSMGDFNQITP